jgi:hypothetical protein
MGTQRRLLEPAVVDQQSGLFDSLKERTASGEETRQNLPRDRRREGAGQIRQAEPETMREPVRRGEGDQAFPVDIGATATQNRQRVGDPADRRLVIPAHAVHDHNEEEVRRIELACRGAQEVDRLGRRAERPVDTLGGRVAQDMPVQVDFRAARTDKLRGVAEP